MKLLSSFDQTHRTREANELLELHYGRPEQPPVEGRPDPLPRLIRAIVAQNTSWPNQEKAMANLHRRFPDPALLADAPLVDVIDALYVAGLANSKAPRLQAMMSALLEATDGTLNLDFLYDLPVEETYAFLVGLPGIGPLSASLVLLFTMGRPVLPVNTGLHRVAQRVGIIPQGTSAEQAPEFLQAALEDEEIYPFHVNMVTLARDFCLASRPKCEMCPIMIVCGWMQGNEGEA